MSSPNSPLPLTSPPPRPRSLPLAEAAALPPPFPLIAAHFGAGLAWAIVAAGGLAVVAPVLAHGGFLDPRVLALTHCFTLGFLTTVITGVLYQIFPAMLGVSCRSHRVAWFSLVTQVLGTALLVAGLLLGRRELQGAGWVTLFAATYGIAWNLFPQRRKAPRNRVLGLYISYAHVAFGFAMFIGLARIGDGFGWWTTPRLELLAAHFQFAALGFGTLTAIGVGSRMVPAFVGAEARAERPLGWMHRVMLSGTVVFATGAIGRWPVLSWGGALLLAAPVVMFLRLGGGWFGTRGRRPTDPAVGFIGFSLLALAAALPLGFLSLWYGLRAPGLLAAYPVTVLLPWLGGLIAGVSYRVLPALSWQYRFGRGATPGNAPPQASLVLPRLGWGACLGFGLGGVLLIAGLLTGIGALARSGAALASLGLTLTLAHHLLLARPIGTIRHPGREAAGRMDAT